MNAITLQSEARGRSLVGGAPEGFDAWLLADMAARGGQVMFVSRDEARMARTADTIRFFAPATEIIEIPAWDCLPYDRLSPKPDVAGRRVAGLVRLAALGDRPAVILTTTSAALQRVPMKKALTGRRLALAPGSSIRVEKLISFLETNGFHRTDTVMETGEYAARGGIVDIFAPGADRPARLDFFGDDIEDMRSFDPESQRTIDKLPRLELHPVSEVVLDEESIARFRTGYRERFGAVGPEDQLYLSVSEGRRHMGMEHWLPLFHPALETIFDYAPGAALFLDSQIDASVEARLEQIAEYFHARDEMRGSRVMQDAPDYKALHPETLYIGPDDWRHLLADKKARTFSPFDAAGAEDAGGRPGRDFADIRSQPGVSVYEAFIAHAKELSAKSIRVMLAVHGVGSGERLATVLREHGAPDAAFVDSLAEAEALPAGTIPMTLLALDHGFAAPGFAIVSEQDLLGERFARPARKRKAEQFISDAGALSEGDLVVHVDHGIGRYEGLETITAAGAPHDCLRLVYQGGDKLYVPVENIEMLSRFGSEEGLALLDKLGGAGWQARKAKLKQRIRDMAEQLIRIAAARKLKTAPGFEAPEGAYDEFCARFPYEETEDQAGAIHDVLSDLAAGRPMDRLVCGDVGFGKTEVALRAAFVAAMSGWQVAVVVPTTLLALQHHKTFADRFRDLPVRVAQLSRLTTTTDAKRIREEMSDGKVDIVVGTHALLSKNIAFANLGLLIVDEEQHFGVAHKERLKQLKADVHVLTLTATPIPRTLQLALTGVRELSVIATPPVDRLAVRTFILPYDPVVVREAIQRELHRGGQVFYVCPRIGDMDRLVGRLRKLVPDVRLAIAHGQMGGRELEDVMQAFAEGRFDVLIATNIIESGLDLPNVNTMVIHRADMLGLAQLYQLRGRIGRSKIRAYAYLTVPDDHKITPTAERRLHVMQTLDSLGAGFSLASHDLDIRGAGNLLGEEQSGHIKEVGIELYQQMLEEAVANIRDGGDMAGDDSKEWSPAISIGTPVLIPEAYVQDLGLRLGLYRRMATLADEAESENFAAELIDRFGKLPDEVENLLKVLSIKRTCKQANIEKLDAGPKGAVISFRGNSFDNPAGLVGFISQQTGAAKLRPDHKLVVMRAWEREEDRIRGVTRLVRDLAAIAEG